MSTVSGQTGTDLDQVLRQGRQLISDASDWLSPVRERATQKMANMVRPDRKKEAWRYTTLGFLDQKEFHPQINKVGQSLQLSDIEELLLAGDDGNRLVFVNGHLAPALSLLSIKHDGMTIKSLAGQLGDVAPQLRDLLDTIAEQKSVFGTLNTALMSDGALIHVSKGVTVEKPIEILHISLDTEEPAICHPRHLIVLEEGAQAEVIERYCSMSDDAAYFNNVTIEVALGAGSGLTHVRSQEESANAQHLSDLQVRLGENGRYQLVLASLGGNWSRNDVRVTFTGEGGEADLNGLMLANDQQLNDVHLDIRHEVPRCTSRESFKGILDGKGRVIFDGRILVAQDAQETDAQLTNDNLMLSRSSEVDTKPQLEIFADDVKCSHGTTVGELDSDMLFYLRSRGISQTSATQMLCQGFAQSVLKKVSNEALLSRVNNVLAKRLMQKTKG